MKIGSFNTDQRILIVAEIGNNHEGRFDIAQQLVREAAACGADAVKFQTFKTEDFVRRRDTARFTQLKRFELTPAQFAGLADLAHSLNLLFISTPLDMGSVSVLEPLVDAFKVASGDNNFYPLIGRIADTGKPLIISAGLSDLHQVLQTLHFVRRRWAERSFSAELAILHCVSSYPVPIENANLRSIPFLREKLDCTIGYSDHTPGEDACLLAAALGARLLEKHFTLDKNFSEFRDHKLSTDPEGLRSLIERVRQAETMMGVFDKQVQPCEAPLLPVIRRSVVAAADLRAGHRLGASDLTWIRPAGGLPPGEERLVAGKTLKKDLACGDFVLQSDVE